MTDYQKKIDTIVEEALTEKTFSLEIVQKIKALKNDLITLQEANEELREDFDNQKITLEKETSEKIGLEEKVQKLQRELSAWDKRENDLTNREIKQEIIETRLYETQNSRNEIKELVSIIFRNPTVVRSVVKTEVTPGTPYPGSNSPAYPNLTPVTNTERETLE